MKRYALLCLLLAFAWPLDAQEIIEPLPAVYYMYGDTTDVQTPWRADVHDSLCARIKPFASLEFALPKTMTEADGHPVANDPIQYRQYEDSIGVWMSCPEGYTITVATSWSVQDHWQVGTFKGPFSYGLYWSPFHCPKYVEANYGGVLYATVEVHQTRGSFEHTLFASVDQCVLKYLAGTLSVKDTGEYSSQPTTWYTFPLLQQVRVGDDPFRGTPAEAGKVLPPGLYISKDGYKLAVGGRP